MVTMLVVAMLVVAMLVPLDLVAPGHDEYASVQMYDLDLRSIQPRQRRPGDDLGHGTECGMSVAQIKNAIERVQQGVELVGAEQHADSQLTLDLSNQFDHAALMGRIQTDQRL